MYVENSMGNTKFFKYIIYAKKGDKIKLHIILNSNQSRQKKPRKSKIKNKAMDRK